MDAASAEIFARAREQLADAPREALGTHMVPRRILGIPRAPRIIPAGTAWHLGVFLLTEDAVFATGEVVRARHEAIRGYTAEAQRQRSELAAAASRGGFADGVVVHIGWEAPGEALLRVEDGVPVVRWSVRGGWMPLQDYLRERIELLAHPPTGST
ncbi:glutaminase [Microbacterium sp. C7(2022)]|uniref:glutaminase n=1 Tax=Microbacterium sp. C7(2022) TaxID=2992759 RepID=UPI00237A92DB|nr:glutaminase [Microbacterium sp. C7(2022)]MDE0545243.1 glutaminase [Microbacterium sp. C7(2022)]